MNCLTECRWTPKVDPASTSKTPWQKSSVDCKSSYLIHQRDQKDHRNEGQGSCNTQQPCIAGPLTQPSQTCVHVPNFQDTDLGFVVWQSLHPSVWTVIRQVGAGKGLEETL